MIHHYLTGEIVGDVGARIFIVGKVHKLDREWMQEKEETTRVTHYAHIDQYLGRVVGWLSGGHCWDGLFDAV